MNLKYLSLVKKILFYIPPTTIFAILIVIFIFPTTKDIKEISSKNKVSLNYNCEENLVNICKAFYSKIVSDNYFYISKESDTYIYISRNKNSNYSFSVKSGVGDNVVYDFSHTSPLSDNGYENLDKTTIDEISMNTVLNLLKKELGK